MCVCMHVCTSLGLDHNKSFFHLNSKPSYTYLEVTVSVSFECFTYTMDGTNQDKFCAALILLYKARTVTGNFDHRV